MTELKSEFYHAGEAQLQQQVGSRERTEQFSKVLMKDHLIDQHREFYAGLEYLFVSAVDPAGTLRATMISGAKGFLSTPDTQTLRISAIVSDVLMHLDDLKPGAMIGVVGIDMSNRRRNRMHGRIASVTSDHIDIRVTQSYGNCPKYTNVRTVTQPYSHLNPAPPQTRNALSDQDRDTIRAADMFLIASFFDGGTGAQYDGADMSTRSGLPGFVKVDGNTLTLPDYFGNNLFNTFGNLQQNPVTALLFIDFQTGDTTHLNGITRLIDDPVEIAKYPKALRLLQIDVTQVRFTPQATTLRWVFHDASPYSPTPHSNQHHL